MPIKWTQGNQYGYMLVSYTVKTCLAAQNYGMMKLF